MPRRSTIASVLKQLGPVLRPTHFFIAPDKVSGARFHLLLELGIGTAQSIPCIARIPDDGEQGRRCGSDHHERPHRRNKALPSSIVRLFGDQGRQSLVRSEAYAVDVDIRLVHQRFAAVGEHQIECIARLAVSGQADCLVHLGELGINYRRQLGDRGRERRIVLEPRRKSNWNWSSTLRR